MLAVDAYELDQRGRGLASVSVERARRHLDKLLRLAVNGGRRLAWLTPARAAQLYLGVQSDAVDTHRNALAVGRSFGRFCADRGWLLADPFARVKAVGRRRRGKPQLHVDETRTLLEVCLAEGSRASYAVATTFMHGLGASEVVERQVRDLDDGGRVLRVTRGKNAHRVRAVEVADELRVPLVELAAGRPSAAYLFGEGDLDRPSRYWIYYHCKRLCAVAKVPLVSPHGLRGTHSTIALGEISTARSVSAALQAAAGSLGHAPGSPITASTYVAPGALDAAQRRVAMRVLKGGREPAGNPSPETVTSRSRGAV